MEWVLGGMGALWVRALPIHHQMEKRTNAELLLDRIATLLAQPGRPAGREELDLLRARLAAELSCWGAVRRRLDARGRRAV